MPIANYGVLKGNPQSGKVVTGAAGGSAHYRIYCKVESGTAEADVNIASVDGSEVLYAVYDPFVPPNPGALVALPLGITPLDRAPGGLTLDFVRETVSASPMVNRADMSLLPLPAGDQGKQLQNAVIELLDEAVSDPDGAIYAFGSSYSDRGGAQGLHDIHMNQGNPPGRFEADNGIWQDGALFITLPATGKWKALFIAFQTESWRTDAQGDPLK